MFNMLIIILATCIFVLSCKKGEEKKVIDYSNLTFEKKVFLDELKLRNFKYFWIEMDSTTFQIPDREVFT